MDGRDKPGHDELMVDARHNGMCSGRRSRTRVPGMTNFAIEVMRCAHTWLKKA
jgi:hypothetical protein